MRHRIRGRKLNRTSEHRIALLRGLATELLRHGKVRTTVARAKELRPYTERLITKAKRQGLHARRLVLREIHDKGVVHKLFDTVAARYASRPGGYTRIVRVGRRQGDQAEMAVIELIPEGETVSTGEGRRKKEAKGSDPGGSAEAKLRQLEEKSRARRPSPEGEEGTAPQEEAEGSGPATEEEGEA